MFLAGGSTSAILCWLPRDQHSAAPRVRDRHSWRRLPQILPLPTVAVSGSQMIPSPSKGSSRPPLITPSASPPPHPSLRADVAPPPKRPRLASVSRSSSSRLSVSATDPALDMQKEREASRTRLLDTWSQLAERYSRRLDEDDIVDIRTGEIVKDNGFWRTTRKFNFGEALAVGGAGGTVGDDSQAEETSEDEEGLDELDAFSEAPDFLEEIFAKGLQPIPTATENRGSSDSNDLQEFLEAEKHRKEEYGSDVDEEDLESPRGSLVDSTLSPSPTVNDDPDDDDNGERSSIGDRPATSSSVYESAQEDPTSGDELDDELDNWEPTEANIVVVASGAQSSSEDESESEVEFIETYVPPKPSPVKRRTPPTQLQTPPLSHSSVDVPNPRHAISSPRPLSHLPVDLIPAAATTKISASPDKPKTLRRRSIRRSPTPEVIEISDDEFPALGLTSYSPSPSPPPVPPPPPLSLARARSRALSLVPEVVIRTLPPPPAPAEPDVPRLSRPGPPVKSAREKPPPQKSAVKASPPKKPARKSSGITGKTAESKGKSQKVLQVQSTLQNGREKTPKGDSSSGVLSISPEIGEQPATPTPAGQTVKPPGRSSRRDRTSQKRKRTSSEHETPPPPTVPSDVSKGKATMKPHEVTNGEALVQLHDIVADTPSVRAVRATRQHPSPRSRSRSRHATPSDHHSQSSSEEDINYQSRRVTRRLASVSTSSSIQPPYTPHATPLHHPGLYPPIADPRAQQIVTQAMQQLAALLWTPTHSGPAYPYTPTHHRFTSIGPGFMHSTPDHPHPYPLSFDPSMSKATLPPSSPEPPSSPIKPRERRKSLVSRSRSRGRRVSFHVDKEVSGWSESDEYESSPARPLKGSAERRPKREVLGGTKRFKEKGKEKAVTTYRAPSESESEIDWPSDEGKEAKSATAVSKRAQTPGPESPVSSKKGSSKPRTKRDRGSRR